MTTSRTARGSWRTIRFRDDDRAQALLETVLVAPLILFAFFAIIQLVLVGFTYQAVKKAAFMSARSLAVHHAVGEEDAVRNAKAAASIALAPASQPARGEVALMVVQSVFNNINTIVAQAETDFGFAPNLFDFFDPATRLQTPPGGPMSYGVRLVTAYHRLGFYEPDQSAEGFRWQIRAFNDEIREVLVDITYRYPLYVPGFTELWNYLRGPRMEDVFDRSAEEGAVGMPASIRLPARVAVGYEAWSGVIRLESAVELEDELRSDGGDAPANPLDGMQETLDQAKDLSEQAKEKAEEAEEWREIQEEKEAQYQDECVPMPVNPIQAAACESLWNEAQNAKAIADNLEAQAEALQNQANNLVSSAEGQLNGALGDAVSAVNDLADYLSAPCP